MYLHGNGQNIKSQFWETLNLMFTYAKSIFRLVSWFSVGVPNNKLLFVNVIRQSGKCKRWFESNKP